MRQKTEAMQFLFADVIKCSPGHMKYCDMCKSFQKINQSISPSKGKIAKYYLTMQYESFFDDFPCLGEVP